MVKTATWRHGSELREFREQRLGLSQQAAATRVGVSIGAYSAWERGTAVPKRESLVDLIERLGVPPEVVGYEAPSEWELVPAVWIRAELAAAEERARLRHDEVMKALGDLSVQLRARR
jgi:transcriptional regulator with XRE-family HTH domain